MRALWRFILFLLAFPALLQAAGHDVSTVRFVPHSCCYGDYPPVGGTAWDGTHFLTIAGTEQDRGLFGWFSDADPSGGTGFPLGSPGGYLYLLSGGNGQYFAIVRLSSGIEFMKLDSAGHVQSTVPIYLTDSGIRTVAIANDGTQVLFVTVAGDSATSATLQLFDGLTGRHTRSATMPIGIGDNFVATASSDGFIVATSGSRGVRAFTIRADGTTATTQIAPANPSYGARVAIDVSHERIAVAWMDGAGHVYGATALPDGRVSAPALLPLGRSTIRKIALLGLASGYAVVWDSEAGTSAMRFDENFNPVDTQPVLIGSGGFVAGASAGSTIDVAMYGTLLSTVTVTSGPAGLAIGSPVVLTTAVRQSMTSLASGNIDFSATWVEESPAGPTARMGRVSHSGVPLDGIGIPLAGTLDNTMIIRGGDSQFLGVQETPEGVFAIRFSTAGTPLDAAPIKITSNAFSYPSVCWNGSGYLVVWTHDGTLFESFIGAATSTTATPPRQLTLTSPAYTGQAYVYLQSLAWDGSRFLLAASVGNPPGDLGIGFPNAVAVMRLLPDGTAFEAPVTVSHDAIVANVASSGTEFLVILDSSVSSSVVVVRSAAGALQVSDEIPVFPFGGISSVAFDGTGYLAAIRYKVLGSSWLAAVRIDRNGKASLPLVTEAYEWDANYSAPFIAVNAGGEAAIAMTEDGVPPSLTERARIYLLSEMTGAMPAPPPAPRRVSVQFEMPLATVTWESDDAPAFAIESSSDRGASWYTVLTAGSTTRTAAVMANSGDLIRVRAVNAGGASAGVPVSISGEPRRRAARR